MKEIGCENGRDRGYRQVVLTTKTGEPRKDGEPTEVGRRWLELNAQTRHAQNGQINSAQLDGNFNQAKRDVEAMDELGPGDVTSF